MALFLKITDIGGHYHYSAHKGGLFCNSEPLGAVDDHKVQKLVAGRELTLIQQVGGNGFVTTVYRLDRDQQRRRSLLTRIKEILQW